MRYFAMVAAGAALWGLWPFFLRPSGMTGAQSALLVFLTMSLPAPFLLRREALRDRRATAAVAVLGLGDAANAALFFAALRDGPVSVAVLTHYLCPLLLALAAPWVLRERPSIRARVGAPVTLLGLAMLIGVFGEGSFAGRTAALGAGSAVFFAINVLASKEASRAYSPLALTALHAPLSAVAVLLFFGAQALPAGLDGAVLRVIVGAAVCGMGGNILFNMGLRRVPAAAAGALTYLEPLTASLVGWAVFSERLTPVGLAGGVLVLVAGAWVASEQRGAAPPVPAASATP